MDDARSRTRYRFLVAALTGAATVGSLTATGLTAGAIAQAARDDLSTSGSPDSTDGATNRTAATASGSVRWQERPRRTVVRRHHVVRVARSLPAGAASPDGDTTLGGGTVSSAAPAGSLAGRIPGAPGPGPRGGRGAGPGTTGPGSAAPSTPTTPSTPLEPPPPAPPAPQPSVPSTGS